MRLQEGVIAIIQEHEKRHLVRRTGDRRAGDRRRGNADAAPSVDRRAGEERRGSDRRRRSGLQSWLYY